MTTLQQARDDLADYEAAIRAVSTGQSYSIGSRQLTRANLAELRAQVAILQSTIQALEAEARTDPPKNPTVKVASWT